MKENESPVVIVDDKPMTRQYRTSGMYTVVIPREPHRREEHSRHNPRYYDEVWVDGSRYPGSKLREIRKTHR